MGEKKTYPKKRNQHTFKKGHKKTPNAGRPSMTPEQKQVAMMTRTKFKTILNQFMDLTLGQISEELKNPNRTVLEISVLKHLDEMHRNGSMDRVDWSLDHIAGAKPKKSEMKLTGNMQQTKKIDLSSCTTEELKLLRKLSVKTDS